MSLTSESVWFEQVDTALINHIRQIVKLPGNYSAPTSVPVKVRKPDEDFKIEVYPCITIYNLYSVRDEERYFPDEVVVSTDSTKNTLVLEKSAIPYSLYYQIDFWATQQSQMNAMTRLWLGHHPDRSFNLPVKDISGKDRNSFVLMTDDLKKSDLLSGDKRVFHSILTYRVWVELDERISRETSMVTTIPYPDTTKM